MVAALAGFGTGAADQGTNMIANAQKQQNALDDVYANHMATTYDQYQSQRKSAADEANRQYDMVNQVQQKYQDLSPDMALDAFQRNYIPEKGVVNWSGVDQYVQGVKKGYISQRPDKTDNVSTGTGAATQGQLPNPATSNAPNANFINQPAQTNWLGQPTGPGRVERNFERRMGLAPGEYERQVNEPMPKGPQFSSKFGGVDVAPEFATMGHTQEIAAHVEDMMNKGNVSKQNAPAVQAALLRGEAPDTSLYQGPHLTPMEKATLAQQQKIYDRQVSEHTASMVKDGVIKAEDAPAWQAAELAGKPPDPSILQRGKTDDLSIMGRLGPYIDNQVIKPADVPRVIDAIKQNQPIPSDIWQKPISLRGMPEAFIKRQTLTEQMASDPTNKNLTPAQLNAKVTDQMYGSNIPTTDGRVIHRSIDGTTTDITPPLPPKAMVEKLREKTDTYADAFDANNIAHKLLAANPQAAGFLGEMGAKYGGMAEAAASMANLPTLSATLDNYLKSDASGQTRTALVTAEAKTLQFLKSNKGGMGNGINMEDVEQNLSAALTPGGSQVRGLAGLEQVNKMIAGETLRAIGQIEIDPKTGQSSLPTLVQPGSKTVDMKAYGALVTRLMDQSRYGLSRDMAEMVASTLAQKQM